MFLKLLFAGWKIMTLQKNDIEFPSSRKENYGERHREVGK